MDIIKLSDVEDKIIELRGLKVILDSDISELYGVETKRINEAVSNNPDKFPKGYILETTESEATLLRSKISTLNNLSRGEHTKYPPKAFTEKGLYMLATILKSKKATQTTLAIVEAFANIRELSRTMAELSNTTDEFKQKTLMQKGGEIISALLDEDIKTSGTETTIELNFAVLKLKHTIKREKE
ncbi:hypothetical protein EZS27_009382 [termite gut metagenome]|uniref:KilA-N DNA-binding domain-containing protein n=1 Tax=termite gut metagenome TaxID=433724 RepID=A0A5J4SAZ7_9ZZZZ